jgi:nucleotide-binding universal stress UspA family protein
VKILLPIDNSPFSTLAIQTVLQHAKPQDIEVIVLHVVDVLANLSMYDSYGPAIEIEKIEAERLSRAAELVNESAKTISAAGFEASSRVERGEPKNVIVEKAIGWGADLIVMGSHGRKGVDRFLLGSVSEAVVRHAPCSVYIVRSPQLQTAQEATKSAKKCAHPACTCIPKSGKYCSAPCEATETMPDIDCRCGHPECRGRAH